MSRVIKFRAWDDQERKMIYGFDQEAIGIGVTQEDQTLYCWVYDASGDYRELDLMQFVEWFDRNGMPIFEGDVISYDLLEGLGQPTKLGLKRVVVMRPTGAIGGWDSNIKVIGNIYANPELL